MEKERDTEQDSGSPKNKECEENRNVCLLYTSLPQRICTADFESGGELTFKFRVRQAWKTAVLEVYQGETRIASMKKKYLEPAIMGNVSIKKETLISRSLPLTFVLTEGGAS